jgi:hypothetical protein
MEDAAQTRPTYGSSISRTSNALTRSGGAMKPPAGLELPSLTGPAPTPATPPAVSSPMEYGANTMGQFPGVTGGGDSLEQIRYGPITDRPNAIPMPKGGVQQGNANAQATVQQWRDSLNRMRSSTDPQVQAIEQDRLARNIYSSLQADGHDVKWQGDQIVIDGRPYTLAGAAGDTRQGGGTSSLTMGTAQDAPAPQASYTPNYVDPSRVGTRAEALQHLQSEMQRGIGRTLNEAELNWVAQTVGFTGGLDDNSPVYGDMMNAALDAAFRQYGSGSGGGGGQGAPGPTGRPTPQAPAWSRMGPTYTPGEIGTEDLDQFSSMDSILGRIGPLPNGPGAVDNATQDLVMRILQNPESMDPRTVELMKSREADTLAEMGQFDDQELMRFAHNTGVADSNWLASERMGLREQRKRNTIQSERDIDIAAASTNMQDRRAAAELGAGVAGQQRTLALQEAGMRKEAVALAADVGLRGAALKGDRYALREQVNAKAAELGLQGDQLQLQYTLGLMNDLTDRYGIDVGADIDLKKLSQQSREFNEELAFRMEELRALQERFYETLSQEDDQFLADLEFRRETAGMGGFSYPGGGGYPYTIPERNTRTTVPGSGQQIEDRTAPGIGINPPGQSGPPPTRSPWRVRL